MGLPRGENAVGYLVIVLVFPGFDKVIAKNKTHPIHGCVIVFAVI
jgi:hypothetical protein